MPQDSAIYGVARIRTNEKRLIGREKMAKLAEASAAEVVRALVEAGYGSMSEATAEDGEEMIERELLAARALVREVTTDERETDIYLMEADIMNLKLLLKHRLTANRAEPHLVGGGCFDQRLLAEAVTQGEYAMLPGELKSALDALELSFIGAPIDPAGVSLALDDAYTAYALARGSAFTKAYFKARVDFDNMTALLRMKALSADAEAFARVLLSYGDISKEALRRAYNQGGEAVTRAAAESAAKDAILLGLAEAARTARPSAMERERDNYLIALAAKGKNEIDTIAPVVGYLLAKEQEARAVRLVLTAKRNGLPGAVIDERMRLLYG